MNKGFTLIELVIVIVILGIIGAVALPQFIDLSGEAKSATVRGVAGALSSANAVNYSSRKANSSKGVTVSNCTGIALALTAGTLPVSYTITPATVPVNTTSTCVLTFFPPSGTSITANFNATGIL